MLREIIDKFYTDSHKDREQHHFYVTDAGKCGRAIFFKFQKGAPKKEIEPHILRLFDHGDHIHKLIMNALLSTRDIHVVSSEVKIPPQELISGRADAVLSDGKDLYVLDIKSMNSMVFKALNEPKIENVCQVQLYLHYFNIQKGILLYVNKDNQQLKEFVVEYDKDKALELVSYLTSIKEKIDSNIVPERIDTYPTDWQCRYCQFKGLCDKCGEGSVSWDSLSF